MEDENIKEDVGSEAENNQSENRQDDETVEQGSLARENDPYDVKKRLGQQAKKYQKELRALQNQIAELRQNFDGQHSQKQSESDLSSGMGGTNVESYVNAAIRRALEQEKEAKSQAKVQEHYKALHNAFEKASDKYDDFDDVVRGDDVPFTPAIRDALLLVHNPAEVAYKLGKNRDELQRISQLHPIEQAREVTKLATAMYGDKATASTEPRQSSNSLGVRANPTVNSQPYSVESIIQRMRTGAWK